MSTLTTSPAPPLPADGLPISSPQRTLTVALAGNPNAGKTTLFNALTGLRQRVANYPGVTVERKEGFWSLSPDAPPARLIDLPGLYSLDAASLDEQIARDVLTGRASSHTPAPDCVVVAVDATNLARNLYLVTQLLEIGRPLVIALTMFDLAARQQDTELDVAELEEALGVPVVPVVTTQRCGLDALAAAVWRAAQEGASPGAGWRLSARAEEEIASLARGGRGEADESNARLCSLAGARYAAMIELYAEELPQDAERRASVEGARSRLAAADPRWWQEPVLARYDWIEQVAARAVRAKRGAAAERERTPTERIDRVATHKILGPLVLLLVMLVVFQAIFSWAQLPMDLIDHGFGSLGDVVRASMPAGLLTDLIVDGVIAGVGGVLVFLPQILLLFLFISLLEDSGYMARAAFIMDRLMRGVGLHGKAFMPLLSSFACAIPGIMATRTIENPKDRLATILIAPFMSCSARLPVYTLMIAAFFTGRKVFGVVSVGVLIIMSMYLLGIVVAVAVAWVLKHTILKSPPPPLVLELPPYRMPSFANVVQTIYQRASMFVRRAGTVILAISILLWALVTFPRAGAPAQGDGERVQPSANAREAETVQPAAGASNVAESAGAQTSGDKGEQIRNSFAGRLGRLIEPAIRPLGFDWQMGIGLIASFAARETLVSTLSIVYNVDDGGEQSGSLIEAVRNARRPDGRPAWTPLVAVSMMVFFVLACQCMSTVAVVKRETNSWRWPLFMVSYMLALAYVASLVTFQGGRLLGFS
ncbi:MAG: ferrous iron transport protein B [Acidobacteria bacterium]|nr:ferrous iron transport protein B [Acidobacteriota bacterium]